MIAKRLGTTNSGWGRLVNDCFNQNDLRFLQRIYQGHHSRNQDLVPPSRLPSHGFPLT